MLPIAYVPVEQLPETAYCIVSAARRFNLPPEALLAILLREAGTIGMKKKNANGTFDLGPMQVNSLWKNPSSPLKNYVSIDELANNLCSNIHTGAWIVAKHFDNTKNIWTAIGMYHSKTESLSKNYMYLVSEKLPKARYILSHNPAYLGYIKAFYGSQP